MMNNFYFTILFALGVIQISAQNQSFQLVEQGTQEPLSYAQITYKQQRIMTDAYGNFALNISNVSSIDLCIKHINTADTCMSLFAKSLQKPIHILAVRVGTQLKEVEVSAQRPLIRADAQSVQISAELIQKTPTLFGEKDVIRTLQMLPQVTGGMDMSADLHVRGADIGHNLVMVDGIPLFNLSHFYGFFSSIDPGVVKSVDFYPGVAPARHNGRLSSFLDINLREGNMNEYHGELGIGLIMSRARVEGPVIKGKSSIHLSMRRSYVDMLARPFMGNNQGQLLTNMGDFMVKYQHKISDKDVLIFSSYFNRDYAYINPINDLDMGGENNWGNSTASLRWLRRVSSNTQVTSKVYFSRYDFGIDEAAYLPNSTELVRSSYQNAFENIGAGIDAKTWMGKHTLSYGLSASQYRMLMPDVLLFRRLNYNQPNEILFQNKVADRSFSELSAYAQDNYYLNEYWEMSLGVNFMYWPQLNAEQSYFVAPRATLSYQPHKKLNIFAGYGANAQALHHIRISRLQLPTDMWINASEQFPVSTSHIYNVGTKYKISSAWELQVEGYYRPLNNVVMRREGLSLYFIDDEPEKFIFSGRGETYGIELFNTFQFGKFSGFLSYSFQNSTRQSDSLNNGNPFPFDFLRQHNVNLFLTYQIKKNFNINTAFTYGSGMPYQIAFQRIGIPPYFSNGSIFNSETIDYIGEKNGHRLPDFHVLNVGFDWSKKGKRLTHQYNVDIYNVYFRANPYFIGYDFTNNDKFSSYSSILFMPSFTYSLKF